MRKPTGLLRAAPVVCLMIAAIVGAAAQTRQPGRVAAKTPTPAVPAFSVVEATIPEMRAALDEGRVTSRELVKQYLARIATYEDRLHAAMTVNANALEEADARDRERAAGKVRGPLHGIPIALKDNIHTTDMPTTGGALAFEGLVPPYEATLTKNLRDAGAIIIAKTVLTELANWVAGGPTPMPGNYNAVGGYGLQPVRSAARSARGDRRRPARRWRPAARAPASARRRTSGRPTSAPKRPARSSARRTRTCSSAIKPTVGRISRYGVIPITADQDTPGPMARTVTDAAIMLGALESAAPDPNDPATQRLHAAAGSRLHEVPAARRPARRAHRHSARVLLRRGHAARATSARGGLTTEQATVMADAIAVLKAQGAVIVDPADIPSVVEPDASQNFLLWDTCSGGDAGKGKDANCSVVFKYGMKRDFNTWLASLGAAAPVKTLTELRDWNLAHTRAGAIKYGQSQPRHLGRDGS